MSQPTRRQRRSRDRASRGDAIVARLTDAFEQLMEADPVAFRIKFRKMARDPFAFYRGTACLFYADLTGDGPFAGVDDPWVDEVTSRIWVHGDLHAENFGTYLDAQGRLVFDVNDFDEAYLGAWTWDLRRFTASLALMSWQKALPDDVIDDLVGAYVRAYVEHVQHYVDVDDDSEWALTLDTAEGGVLAALQAAKLSTRFDMLESMTVIEDYRRRFKHTAGVRPLEADERDSVCEAFGTYLETIPQSRRGFGVIYDVLDVVGRSGLGIGSAGLPAYSVLIEGYSQALDNDVVLSMKQGNVAAISRVVDDERARQQFEHHGHRTVLSQRALQAHADRFLGWTSLPGRAHEQQAHDAGVVVRELSPYEADLEWEDITEPDDMRVLVTQLGRATAKIHCVADEDDAGLVAVNVEEAVAACIEGDVDGLVDDMRAFAHRYAEQTREDYRLFVDAFRAGAFSRVAPA